MFRLISYVVIFVLGAYVGNTYLGQDAFKKVSFNRPSLIESIQKKPSEVKNKGPASPPVVLKTIAAPAAVPPKPSLSKKERYKLYTVQVASLRDYAKAQKFVKQLNDKEINAYIAPIDLQKKSDIFRVFIGEYANKADAEAKLSSLRNEFKGAFVQGF